MDGLTTMMRPANRLNHIARRVVIAILIIAVAANAGFWLAHNRLTATPFQSKAAGTSERLILAIPVDSDHQLVGTRDNDLILIQGGAPVQQAKLGAPVTALAVASNVPRFYAGLANGQIHIFDQTLAPQGELTVKGRVLGLAATSDGTVIVGHGIGAFGTQFFVSAFAPGAAQAAFQTQVGSPITAIGLLDRDTALFGTKDSRVGTVSLKTGDIGWTTTLRSPITGLLALPDGDAILAGGNDGTLSLLDRQGQIEWAIRASQYPLRGLAYDADQRIGLAGDANGVVTAVSRTGAILLTAQVAQDDIQEIAPLTAGKFLTIPREGQWQQLDSAAIGSSRLVSRLRNFWLATNLVLALALAVSTIVAIEPARVAGRRHVHAVWRGRLGYLLVLPAIVFILFFSYYAGGLALYYSLTNFSLRNVTEFIGFENYRNVLLHDTYFRAGMVNMVIITVTSIIKALTVPLLVAELVFWLRRARLQYLFRTLFILPAVVPGLVFTLMWRQVYDPSTGLFNQLLKLVGLGQFQRAWLGDSSTAIWAVVGVGFPFIDAFAFLIFLGGLLNINPEYFDAARVDGARWLSRFLHLDVPLLLPQFRIMLFFALVGSIQGFASIFILTRGGPGFATYVPALQMYLQISDGDFGYASAIGAVLFVMIMILTIFALRFRRNDAIEGA